MSVSWISRCGVRKQAADDGQIAQARRHRENTRRSSSRMRPARRFGLTVLEANDRADLAIAERRQIPEPGARDVAHLDLQRQRDLIVVMRSAA